MSLRHRPLTALATMLALALTTVVAGLALAGPAAAAGTLTVTVHGLGTVNGPDISCTEVAGSDCSQFYSDEQVCDPDLRPPCHAEPTVVELVAGPDLAGFAFQGFTGCSTVSGRTCTVVMAAARSVTATFADVTNPSVSLTAPTQGSTEGAAMTITANASDNAAVARVDFLVRGVVVGSDNGPPYLMSFNTTGVPDGSAVVAARAYDTANRVAQSSGVTVTIDHTSPTVTVTGPDGQTFGPGSTQAWTFAVSDASTVTARCVVRPSGGSGMLNLCSDGTSGHEVSDLPEGSYEFQTVMTDQVGNTSSSAPRTFTIDATAPDTSLISGPATGSVVTSRSVSFGFAADDAAATFECRLAPVGAAPSAFAPCTAPGSFAASGLSDGGHRFEVRAVDAVGNVDQTPVVRDFRVDATAPVATLSTQPAKKVKTRKRKVKVTFAFPSSEPGETFRCSLDGAALAVSGSSLVLKVKAGEHTFQVEAVDAVGNVQATPTTYAFRVKRVKKRH